MVCFNSERASPRMVHMSRRGKREGRYICPDGERWVTNGSTSWSDVGLTCLRSDLVYFLIYLSISRLTLTLTLISLISLLLTPPYSLLIPYYSLLLTPPYSLLIPPYSLHTPPHVSRVVDECTVVFIVQECSFVVIQ